MAKSPTERNKDYRARMKLKTGLLSDIDRARRIDLTEQFERTTGDTALVSSVMSFMLRHPSCRVAPTGVEYRIPNTAVVHFNNSDGYSPDAAVLAVTLATSFNVQLRVGGSITPTNAVIRRGLMRQRDELIAAGLWGDDPL